MKGYDGWQNDYFDDEPSGYEGLTVATEEDVFLYLDDLRESGETNMFGALSYIQVEFPELDKKQAQEYLSKWMRTFGERHPED